MNKKCTQIAIGGVFSALCLFLMFLTGLIPFATYVMPMMAGATLIAVVVENGRKTAVLVYISVSLLSVFIVPDREAAMLFIVFFGYYPIIKAPLERIHPRVLSGLAKLVLLNASVVGGFVVSAYVFGMMELLSGMADFGKYTVYILLGAGNVLFCLYDFLVARYTAAYIHWFKPTFLRR